MQRETEIAVVVCLLLDRYMFADQPMYKGTTNEVQVQAMFL
jgi:hypothetical protein